MLAAQDLTKDKLGLAIHDPFFIFEFRNIFDPKTYDELNAHFPQKSVFPATWVDRGGKSHMNSNMPEFSGFTKSEPVWTKLYDRFTDPAVVQKFYELAHSVPSERPKSETRPWQLDARAKPSGFMRRPRMKLRRWLSGLSGNTPVRLTFEFSYLEAGCYLPPHTDVTGKLISLMLYFPDDGVKYPSTAGTEFYRGRNNTKAESGWTTGMMDKESSRKFFEKHEIFYTSEFGPNKLVGFIKTSDSWHGVHHLELPPNASRRSLNINYYLA
jgi:hypothetical protein